MKITRAGKYQRGLSLVELMVALLLGVFLIGGLLQIFINTKQTYRMQEGLSRLQENGRFAIDFITKDVRMTGFLGCAEAISGVMPHIVNNAAIPPPSIPALTSSNIIGGNDAISTNWSADACGNACIAGTDAITLRHGESCGGFPAVNDPVAGKITVPGINTCGINVNDALIIATCNNADIFRTTSINSDKTLVGHEALSVSYLTGAELFMYRDHSYFIRADTGGGSSLWMLDNTQATGGSNPIELVEGIEDMQILYGVDTDMAPLTGLSSDYTPNYFVPADPAWALTTWAQVVSIRIRLTAATIDDNLTAQPVTYTYGNGGTVTDRKIRRVLNATIAVRNRVS